MTKKFHKKPKSSKTYKAKASTSIRGKGGSFIPQAVQTVHKYCEYYQINAGVGQLYSQKFNLNSMFDPDLTNVGHQPMGRDQMITLYNRYRVDKVKVTVQWTKMTDSVQGFHAMIANNDSATLTQTPSNIMEQPFQLSGNTSYANGGSKTSFVQSKTFNLHSVTGVTKTKYKIDDQYQALSTASPSEVIILHLMAGDVLGASTYACTALVKLEYFTTWFDPNVISQS